MYDQCKDHEMSDLEENGMYDVSMTTVSSRQPQMEASVCFDASSAENVQAQMEDNICYCASEIEQPQTAEYISYAVSKAAQPQMQSNICYSAT